MEKQDSNMFPNSGAINPDLRTLENDARRIDASVNSKESKIYASKKLANFFELEVTLKIFGQVIWHWVFPPRD